MRYFRVMARERGLGRADSFPMTGRLYHIWGKGFERAYRNIN
jgi:hypothetical protein